MSRVLIVDDEPAICWSIREALADEGHAIEIASSAEEAERHFERGWAPDLVVLDVRLPGLDGLSALGQWRERWPDLAVVIMTAFGDLDTAVQAVRRGAFDYLVKPFDLDQALVLFRRALESVDHRPESGHPGKRSSGPAQAETIIGRSPVMQQVFRQIALVAPSSSTVLITGESGTGKELVARAIHRHSPRSSHPFVAVCLPALNPGLVEAELFGHARGAFTGAQANRPGLFELADGGTLFLDEIGDIDETLQLKLLRVLEQREFFPVGSSELRRVDVRVIAATNRPLRDSLSRGTFRQDLFFRLSAVPIEIPPLRERPEDISLLATHFLEQVTSSPGAASRFSKTALASLQDHRWPGNVRELRNAIEHAAVHARQGTIGREHLPATCLGDNSTTASIIAGEGLPQKLQGLVAEWAREAMRPDLKVGEEPPRGIYDDLLALIEPPLLLAALERTGQNRAAAAELLGLHRGTLRQKLRTHGLDS